MRWTVMLTLAVSLVTTGASHAQDVSNAQDTGPGAAAPRGAVVTEGQLLFDQRCSPCHTIGGGTRVGPDLQGVVNRRSRDWLVRFITAPDKVIESGDPIATALVQQFNQIRMPNLGVTDDEARTLLDHLAAAGAMPATPQRDPGPMPRPPLAAPQSTILWLFLALTGIIVLVFAAVGMSTRSPGAVDVPRAYALRRMLFVVGATTIVALLAATLPLAPYARAETRADRIVYVASRQYDFIFSDEPITNMTELAQVPRIGRLEIPAGTLVEFRVTSLDVNHGFGLYGRERQIVAQTQAMPGYFNRLFVRLVEPAEYTVFCLEYCAAGHHVMRTSVVVQ